MISIPTKIPALVSAISISCAAEKPVKVYILSGQSNMVGIGQVDSAGIRWGKEFHEPTLSVYEGKYDAAKDYSKEKPLQTLALASFGGASPPPSLVVTCKS